MQNVTAGSRLVGLLVIVVLFAVIGTAPFSSGAPERRTGAPGDISTCNTIGCHNSFQLNSGTGLVTITAPSEYSAGESMDLSVRVQLEGAARFGFQLTAKDASDTNIGIWELTGQNTEFASGNINYVTHDQAPFVSNENSWTVRWTAPPTKSGEITFYAAGNAANGNGNNQGDFIYTASHAMSPRTATAVESEDLPVKFEVLDVYPNPFTGRAAIAFTVSEATHVSLDIYDLNGRKVQSSDLGILSVGVHEALVQSGGLPSGIYLYRLLTRFGEKTGSITLVR